MRISDLRSMGSRGFARLLSSPRLAVVCLAWLFILVLAGTLYQVSHSSYDAQEVFFHSWIGRLGPLPFPGAQLALAVLGVNLLGSLLFRIRWIITNTGLLVLHAGLILLLLAGLLSRIDARSSVLSLVEGHDYGVALDPLHWELYVQSDADLVAASLDSLHAGSLLQSPIPGLFLQVEQVVPNSMPAPAGSGAAAGAAPVQAIPPDPDPTRNVPSLVVQLSDGKIVIQRTALFGADQDRTRVWSPGHSFTMWLAHAAYPLPARVRLLDFRAVFFPGSDLPKSFQSSVLLTDSQTSREAVISMNHPLRYKGYTFYQSSYGTDSSGKTFSVLQVVQNPGRLMPYLASFIIVAGLAVHVLLRRSSSR